MAPPATPTLRIILCRKYRRRKLPLDKNSASLSFGPTNGAYLFSHSRMMHRHVFRSFGKKCPLRIGARFRDCWSKNLNRQRHTKFINDKKILLHDCHKKCCTAEMQHLNYEKFLVKPDNGKWDCIDCTKQSDEARRANHALTFPQTSTKTDWRYIVGLATYRWTGEISLKRRYGAFF